MKALCDAADELKKRSGVKATGRKLTTPVYGFTLNWHEADNPDAAHMVTVHLPWVKQVPGGPPVVRPSGHSRRFL
jgi:hypothetical protein